MPRSSLRPSRSTPTRHVPQAAAAVARDVLERAAAEAIGHLKANRFPAAAARVEGLDPKIFDSPIHLSLVGRILRTVGNEAQALRWFERTLACAPDHPEALTNRAYAMAALGRHEDAVTAFGAAIPAAQGDPALFYHFGLTLVALGEAEPALTAFDVALRLKPVFPEALRAAGNALGGLGHVDRALRLFDEALRLRPDDLDAALDRANLLHAADRCEAALGAYDDAVARHPKTAALWSNRGQVLHDLGRMAEALDSLDAALRLDFGLPQAHHNRGNVLFRLSRFAEAVASFDRALALRPVYAEALCSRGLALKMLGRFEAAAAAFEASLALAPDFVYARSNRGELRLLLGDMPGGWPDYELRFFTERQTKPALSLPVPEWSGEPCLGKRIVVFADQGNGDTIQFARFLQLLAARGALVTFLCPARLQRLFRPVTVGIEICERIADETVFDYQIALSSMPGAFRVDEAFLAGSAPYLEAEADRVALWRRRIGPEGLRVGLCWRGSQNWQCDPGRSVPLAALEPLQAVPDIRLFSLQMPDNAEIGAARITLEPLGPDFDAGPDAFLDTAAVMEAVDLVITCDTSIAHLAGALGRPTWVMLQAVPEWRWMLDRPTSPWYPSMRLFRQETLGDWSAPVIEMVRALGAGRR